MRQRESPNNVRDAEVYVPEAFNSNWTIDQGMTSFPKSPNEKAFFNITVLSVGVRKMAAECRPFNANKRAC